MLRLILLFFYFRMESAHEEQENEKDANLETKRIEYTADSGTTS